MDFIEFLWIWVLHYLQPTMFVLKRELPQKNLNHLFSQYIGKSSQGADTMSGWFIFTFNNVVLWQHRQHLPSKHGDVARNSVIIFRSGLGGPGPVPWNTYHRNIDTLLAIGAYFWPTVSHKTCFVSKKYQKRIKKPILILFLILGHSAWEWCTCVSKRIKNGAYQKMLRDVAYQKQNMRNVSKTYQKQSCTGHRQIQTYIYIYMYI